MRCPQKVLCTVKVAHFEERSWGCMLAREDNDILYNLDGESSNVNSLEIRRHSYSRPQLLCHDGVTCRPKADAASRWRMFAGSFRYHCAKIGTRAAAGRQLMSSTFSRSLNGCDRLTRTMYVTQRGRRCGVPEDSSHWPARQDLGPVLLRYILHF